MNFKNILKTILLIFLVSFYACDKDTNSEENSDSDVIDNPVDYTLTTKNIAISQTIEGITESRSVIIQTPIVVDLTKNYPIVFAFHGNGGTNTSWVNRLREFTNNGEYIGIYPQGFLKSWNLGQEASSADDVAFVDLIIDELQNYNNLNFDKMYAIGTSNGSGMVNKLGIETNHFKAIAPVVSQLMESSPLLPNTQPISVYQINGAADTTIPIDGGPRFGHVFLDGAKSAALWANHFSCNQNPEIQTLGADTLSIYTVCDNSKEIRYLRVENGGHGLLNSTMIADIWTFFQRF
jgi:poly(3-hydroxybutyrate) depolymerase